jgi:hypothetical protein
MQVGSGPSLSPICRHRSVVTDLCVWQVGLAHFGILFWPTPGTLKGLGSVHPVVVAAVGKWESLLGDFQGLWEGWENSFIVFPCFP